MGSDFSESLTVRKLSSKFLKNLIDLFFYKVSRYPIGGAWWNVERRLNELSYHLSF